KLVKVQVAGSEEERVGITNNALAVAQQLSSVESVLAVIGHFSSSASLQAADEYANNDLIAVSPTSTAVRLGDYRNFLRTPPNDAVAAQYLAEYTTQQLGLERVAIVHLADGSSAYSQSFADEFRKHLPSGSYVYEGESCDLSRGLDFSEEACVNNAVAEGAEAILMVPDTDPQLALALRVAGVNADIVLLGADSVYNSLSLDEDGVYEKQLTVAVPWHRSGTEFEQNANLMYSTSQVNWRSAMSYDAVQAIAGVLEDIPNVPSREEFLENMNELREDGFDEGVVAGRIQFDDKGDRIQGQDGLGVLVTVDPEEGFVFVNE
ncbi:MAG: ABC transporter substrate-binding protein, partial [Cyanobacteria bacterium J06638_22]